MKLKLTKGDRVYIVRPCTGNMTLSTVREVSEGGDFILPRGLVFDKYGTARTANSGWSYDQLVPITSESEAKFRSFKAISLVKSVDWEILPKEKLLKIQEILLGS